MQHIIGASHPTARSQRILVTGAAGLIGRELCGVLAGRGHGVVALVHRSRELTRNDGTAMATAPWSGDAPPGSVSLLGGDVSQPLLGLPADMASRLAARLDLIVHCAAVTGFNLPASVYQQVNTDGVAHALGLARNSGQRIPLLQVSTAYVCGDQTGTIAEAPTTARHFVNQYEASKAAAEGLALAALDQGHPVAIARPSIVVGAATDGAIGEFGNIYQLVRLVTEGRIRVLPTAADASLDLVPIDHVVAALADLAERMPAANGRIFHLASGTPVPVEALRRLTDSFPHFHAPRLVSPALFAAERLSDRERQLNDQVTSLYASYLRRSPLFETANLMAVTGRRCPATDAGFLRRVIAYGIASGFLLSPDSARAQRTSG